MDPPHITEFASNRYFEKLNQLGQSGHSQDGASASASASASTTTSVQQPIIPSPSTFILPLRASKSIEPEPEVAKVPEPKPKEKKGFFGLRSKVSLLHSKPAPVPAPVLVPVPVPSFALRPFEPSATSVPESYRPPSAPFDQHFQALPNELQIQILSSLPLTDLLKLRLTSKSWHTLVTVHEASIARYHLDNHVPAYALRLYPADASNMTLYHLCGIWHRLHVAAKLSSLMCEWITKGLFLRTSDAQQREFAPQKELMRRRLIPLLFTIFHFFEMYRKLHLEHLAEHDGHGLGHEPYTLNPIEAKIMSMYDDKTLLRVHEIFPLVISSFCRRLRPPSYAGRVELTLRGYLKDKAPDEVHVAILCIGGLRQVERLWEIKGYNHRRGAVDTWYSGIAPEPVELSPSKPRRGLRSLGRRKSMPSLKEPSKTMSDDAPPMPPMPDLNGLPGFMYPHGPPFPRPSYSPEPPAQIREPSSLVFNTSLAAGMPMPPLAREKAKDLIPDLPVLQQIWTTTAEALILDRKIVERTQDIKRNAAIMMELIREDGMDEEDEWWYGRGSPESVRPPLEAIDEDPMEGLAVGVAM